jgi:uncharacterized membrane protein YsdA (DUF1294 family)/cold shock CspA family protein
MRQTGTIASWKDAQGFGFISREGGGDDVFVHVKAFRERARRPTMGDAVSFDLTTDERGRLRAVNVAYSRERHAPQWPSGTVWLALIFVTLHFAVVVFLASLGAIPVVAPFVYAMASATTFAIYAHDKKAARANGWRIKESTLHWLALLGGWPGALMAQTALRHKTRKPAFLVVFWITVVLNTLGLVVAAAWIDGALFPPGTWPGSLRP